MLQQQKSEKTPNTKVTVTAGVWSERGEKNHTPIIPWARYKPTRGIGNFLWVGNLNDNWFVAAYTLYSFITRPLRYHGGKLKEGGKVPKRFESCWQMPAYQLQFVWTFILLVSTERLHIWRASFASNPALNSHSLPAFHLHFLPLKFFTALSANHHRASQNSNRSIYPSLSSSPKHVHLRFYVFVSLVPCSKKESPGRLRTCRSNAKVCSDSSIWICG